LCLGVNLSPSILFSPPPSSPIPESHPKQSSSHSKTETIDINNYFNCVKTEQQRYHEPSYLGTSQVITQMKHT